MFCIICYEHPDPSSFCRAGVSSSRHFATRWQATAIPETYTVQTPTVTIITVAHKVMAITKESRHDNAPSEARDRP